MDYDDTDFQSRNFQLAGEDNSKSPSSLRPFALPKLDTDDQLQGHLRFGNLTDSEGFFSVGGHDNSWIEVLSTGSSVVGFSSSAAESCSISRSNYVWSEATSTECVEMLLKSVGENEMTGNMNDNVRQQLSGMDSQIGPSNMQPNSSDSPSDSIVVPTENDQSQGTRSRMPEDPLTSQPQFEDIAPFSMVDKAEHAMPSTLSGRKSNYMLDSVSEKCIVSEKLSSASQNTPEGCPAVDNYFKVVHDGDSLDNLNIHSAGVDSDKLSNEAFSELARIQNIYSTDSYHFEQGNHMHANKLEGGMHELQKLTESSDGLLEAITNPVKMLQMNDDTCKSATDSLQPSLSQVEHGAEGHKILVDAHKKPVIKNFSIGEEPSSAKSCQNQSDLNNSNRHPVTPLSTESGELIQSPDGKQPAHVIGAPEETESDGVEDTVVDVSEHGVPEQHQESVDNLKNVVMDDTPVLEDEPGTNSGPQEKEIAPLSNLSSDIISTTVADTSNKSMDKPDCSGGVPSDGSPAGVLEGNDSTISSINHVDAVDKGANSSSEVGGHNVAPVSESSANKSAMSVNSDINSICSSGTVPVAKNPQCEGLATSLASLTTNQSQDKSGDHPDAHTENCQVGRPLQSEDQEISHPQKCQIGGSSVQSEHQGNLATASSLDLSSGKDAQTIIETPLNANDDLNVHIKDNEGNCNDATCGSPTVISCTEPFLQEGGQEGIAVLHRNLTEQTEDKKDPTASAGASPSSEDCSARNIKHNLTSEETNTTGDDRSFSFEVGDPPKVSEKVHRPAWSPFPRSKAALSTEGKLRNP
ncbi:unnamed protein product [Triticum turgidum subsp. durum]|uniref:Uncharacterized protein n=1 Tax=Triticum turgidum subsp. durum TaxID=4567 RepID=A0A9R0QAQ4_TRITD|nr:unnamed protein product [Triticum turgidum subsp. durum]